MIHRIVRPYCFYALLLSIAVTNATMAQNNVTVSGLAYADYSYTIQSDDNTADGDNAFGYRRIYLTTNYSLSERFSGRIRFEASDKSTDAKGRPSPFVKDMYHQMGKCAWGKAMKSYWGQ